MKNIRALSYAHALALGLSLSCASTSHAAYTINITANDPMSFGRIMEGSTPQQNATVTKSGTGNGAYTVGGFNNGITVTNPNVSGGNGATNNLTVKLNANANGTSGSLGNKAYTVNITSNAGSTNPSLAVSTTVVTNRSIAAPVNFGKLFTNTLGTVSSAALTSTATRATATDIQLLAAGGNVTNASGAFTIASGAATTFNGTVTSANRNITANFTTSGLYTNATASFTNATAKVENLTGETLQPLTLTYSADVYQKASLNFNNSSAIAAGGSVQITNASAGGGKRAAAAVNTVSVDSLSNGWTVNGTLTPGMTVNAGQTLQGTASFDSAGKLNGTYRGKATLSFQHNDQAITGAAANDLGSAQWNLSTTVTGNMATTGTGQVRAGQSYTDFGLTSDLGRHTTATLLDGAASTDTNLSMSFATVNESQIISDTVDLTGSDGDLFVLQLTYDATLIVNEQLTYLAWLNPQGKFVNAIEGNSDGGAGANFILGAYNSATDFVLSTYGIDTVNHTVWAVLDHNSTFAATAIPSPATLPTAAILGAASLMRRRRQHSQPSRSVATW